MTAPGYRLVPCPFCGAEAERDWHYWFRHLDDGRVGKGVGIHCTNCDAYMTRCRAEFPGTPDEDLMADLEQQWNRRTAAPQPEPPADLVERAKALFIGLAENMRHERDGDGMWCGDSNSWVNIKIQAEKIAALAQEHAAAEKARADELDRECQESMKTIAEERARADKAEKALAEIAEQDVTEIALDPDWPRRIAAAAIRARKGGGDA